MNTVSIVHGSAGRLSIIKLIIKLKLFFTFCRTEELLVIIGKNFDISATKPQAYLQDIWVPMDLPALFFPPPTPLTQISLHTGWMLQ